MDVPPPMDVPAPSLPPGEAPDQWVVQRVGQMGFGLPRICQRRRQRLLRQRGRLLVPPRILR